VSVSIVGRGSNVPWSAAFFVLGAGACITPPAQDASGASAHTAPSAPAAVAGPAVPGASRLEFTHTSAQLLQELRLGWNLGNSLDVPEGETAWGNPKVTPELLSSVAKAGFKLVRVPITWARHAGSGPDHAIDPAWFARVDEVIGYARDAGLHVVINLHHDGADGFKGVQWIALKDASGNTTDENNAAVKARFATMWSQIAKHFSSRGEELLFESMNEVHDGYGNPDPRHIAFINELNQQFVDVVRASGGDNAKRHLVVPGYNTNIDATLKGFKLPTDATAGRLILSVHYYDPYLFALQGQTHTWGAASPGRDNWGQEDFVVKQFDRLKVTFVDQGVPVLLGEYGATHQDGFDDYRRYYVEYVTKAAVDRGILPVFWDNGAQGSGGEKFGLFDRGTNTVLYPDLMEAIHRAGTSAYALDDVRRPVAK
jgi:aryl-phospho-beta-D-glucosidase BglC (GH1 family)